MAQAVFLKPKHLLSVTKNVFIQKKAISLQKLLIIIIAFCHAQKLNFFLRQKPINAKKYSYIKKADLL